MVPRHCCFNFGSRFTTKRAWVGGGGRRKAKPYTIQEGIKGKDTVKGEGVGERTHKILTCSTLPTSSDRPEPHMTSTVFIY